jgi:hypothetical protein
MKLNKSSMIRWLPSDLSDIEFTTILTEPTSSKPMMMGYVSGATASTAVLRLEIVANFECIPHASVRDYIPVSTPPRASMDFGTTLALVTQNNSIFDDVILPVASKAMPFLDKRLWKNPIVTDRVTSDKKIPVKKLAKGKKKGVFDTVKSYVEKHLPEVLDTALDFAKDYGPAIAEIAAGFI